MTSSPLVKSGRAKGTSTIILLAGIWLFISAWVYGAFTLPNAWNNWIVGGLIILFAATRLAGPPSVSWMSWINCALAVWTFASPWIYGYTGDTARFTNSIVVGIIVFCLGIVSATAHPVVTGPTGEMHAR